MTEHIYTSLYYLRRRLLAAALALASGLTTHATMALPLQLLLDDAYTLHVLVATKASQLPKSKVLW